MCSHPGWANTVSPAQPRGTPAQRHTSSLLPRAIQRAEPYQTQCRRADILGSIPVTETVCPWPSITSLWVMRAASPQGNSKQGLGCTSGNPKQQLLPQKIIASHVKPRWGSPTDPPGPSMSSTSPQTLSHTACIKAWASGKSNKTNKIGKTKMILTRYQRGLGQGCCHLWACSVPVPSASATAWGCEHCHLAQGHCDRRHLSAG